LKENIGAGAEDAGLAAAPPCSVAVEGSEDRGFGANKFDVDADAVGGGMTFAAGVVNGGLGANRLGVVDEVAAEVGPLATDDCPKILGMLELPLLGGDVDA